MPSSVAAHRKGSGAQSRRRAPWALVGHGRHRRSGRDRRGVVIIRRGVLMRGRRFAVVGAAMAGGLLLAALLPAAASAGGPVYVSLGDSFTSGPLIPFQHGAPADCLRSSHNYPSLVAAAIGASSFTDVSCSGATTADMLAPQSVILGTNPPELNALSPATTVVTLGIGGNDLDFANVVIGCSVLSFTSPFGSPCQKHYTSGGTDRLARTITQTAPKVAAVLEDIHQRAPAARVLLVGYPVVLPNSGHGCWPLVPIAFGDVPYLRGVELKLNSMLASEAAAHGATYVNTYTGSIGHDVCQLPGTKWVEGIVPTSIAAPVHPNALGEKAMSRAVLAALR
jgi:lysophospholipase L1-like esterase